jgi:lathosterol oxidase
LVYWLTAGIWHYVIYNQMADQLFFKHGRNLPTWDTFLDQMCLAQSSLFIYASLPVISEFLIENKFTKVYFYVEEVGGWHMYFVYLFLYFVFFEVGIYWVHRKLHENKYLYKYLHALHHKYNKASTLTPWCSIAFNPLDGMAQVCLLIRFGLFVFVVNSWSYNYILGFSLCRWSFFHSGPLLHSYFLAFLFWGLGDEYPRCCGKFIWNLKENIVSNIAFP